MYRNALRAAPRRITTSKPLIISNSKRFLSTAPPSRRSRSWKNTFFRWGLAGAGIYWYNTNSIFNNLDSEAVFLGQPAEAAIESVNDSIHSIQESDKSTVDAILAEKRAREAQLAAANKKSDSQFDQVAAADGAVPTEGEGEEGLEGLEEEAGQQGAFNPETGEINWDCPCLGGMAHGPCGEEFKAAFSCFVYSTEEPKGVECIDKFKGMQDCFRLHPEMYGSELEDDEDEVEEAIREQQAQRAQDDGRDASDSAAKSASSQIAPTSTPQAVSDASDANSTSGKNHEQETKSSNSDWSSTSKEQNKAAEKAAPASAQK